MQLKIFLFLLFLTIITACGGLSISSYLENKPGEQLDIEILRPADTSINQVVRNLLVFVNPELTPGIIADKKPMHTPENRKFEKIPDIEFHSMADLLSGSPRYAVFEPTFPIQDYKGALSDIATLDSICQKANADGCLFLNRQDVDFEIGTREMRFEDRTIKLVSFYKFYSVADKKILEKAVVTKIDFVLDLDEDEAEDMRNYLSEHGPDSLVNDFARQNGEKLVIWLAPAWQRVSRSYYLTGNNEFDSVKSFVQSERWAEVFSIWRRNVNSKNNLVARHASFNAILSYEMEGKLDSALIMARQAYKRFASDEIIEYGLILEERLRENELVKAQLGMQK